MPSGTSRPPLEFRYTFDFPDGRQREFVLTLDYQTLERLCEIPDELPDWTRLEFHQCVNCPLSPKEHPRCPVAVRMVDLVQEFSKACSFDEVVVTVKSKARSYTAETTLQKGIGAMIGLTMATSGCPIMNRLRPMVETHLPFMTLEESTYRIMSMYLTAQYYRARRGLETDWELKELVPLLKETHHVNVGMTNRLRAIRVHDASLNALVNLNASSDFISIAMQSTWLDRFEQLFLDHGGWASPLPAPANGAPEGK